MSVKKVHRFVEALAHIPEVSCLVLWHLSVAQRKTRVAHHDQWEDPRDIAAVIWEEARNVASAYPGPQAFLLTAHEKEDVDFQAPLTSTGFRVDASEGQGQGDMTGSEPPTQEGLLGQLMRHNENKEKTINSMLSSVISYLVRDNEKKSEALEQFFSTRLEMMKTMEELTSKKHEREIAAKEQEAKIERNKEMFGRISSYLPVVVNHLAGKEVVRQKDTELELVATELVRTLSTNQLDVIRESGMFKPEQLVLLGTMLEKVVQRMKPADEIAKDSADAHRLARSPLADSESP